MNKGKIILLNGVSSSGKTSLSKVLVEKLPHFFHFSLDEFDHIIEKMEDRQNGRLIPIATETFYHRNIAMFSDNGVNLIVDHVLHNYQTLDDCLRTLTGYPVLFVGVHCPQKELERRETFRGDRLIGQALNQASFVHKQNEPYHIEVNTYTDSLEQCANQIITFLINHDSLSSGIGDK
ncbi:chloramphenicol phosphotransferase CPT family protein [Litchfieldia alkalitelluris]|uniref:chloramphenicol phosphotransferase CPT family protein n=1 Tax=Litchfieldia alkalitelluris TaxID=304268 RepID=UPI000996F9B5|nr:zeta toxin family protein [Litchfieldia alkalitelluris]